jgi:hypothetical protein
MHKFIGRGEWVTNMVHGINPAFWLRIIFKAWFGTQKLSPTIYRKWYLLLLLRLGVRGASNSAYSGYPELWILRYPAHRYHAVPSPRFEPTTLWFRVRRPNHSATTLHDTFLSPYKTDKGLDLIDKMVMILKGKWPSLVHQAQINANNL